MKTAYEIVRNGCKPGYAFVRDRFGNKWFFGTLKECREFIKLLKEVRE